MENNLQWLINQTESLAIYCKAGRKDHAYDEPIKNNAAAVASGVWAIYDAFLSEGDLLWPTMSTAARKAREFASLIASGDPCAGLAEQPLYDGPLSDGPGCASWVSDLQRGGETCAAVLAALKSLSGLASITINAPATT